MARPVIVGVDDPRTAGDAVDWAAAEAQLRGERLHLVHAWLWEPHQAPESLDAVRARRAGEEALASLAERARARHPGLEISSGVVASDAREALVALSAAAGVLVVGSRGTGGFPGLLVGSTGLYVAAHAVGPVVVVHDGHAGRAGGVVVGLQGREPDQHLLTFAFDSARRRGAALHVLHAWSFPPVLGPGHDFPPVYEAEHVAAEEERLVAERLAAWRERYPEVEVSVEAVRAGPAKRLVALSERHRLVVVGRRGRPEGLLGRLGSVSQAVVQHARCPVAVVPDEWSPEE
ncbi:universal stress protein [Kitasatospora sp. NPDC052896]|uniref:universal stress protein n=1 Tax=Kitasatospora sp. NPDC052896 TaxID=3364061 RepID=UPI0037C80C7B